MTTVNHGAYYAVKRVSKKNIVAKRQEEHMLFEKAILKSIQCDFIVRYHRHRRQTQSLMYRELGSVSQVFNAAFVFSLCRLHAAFKDTRYIHMVMEFCAGGEIWTKLKEV